MGCRQIILDYLTILSKLKKKEAGGEEAWWNLVYQLDFPQQDLITIGKTIKKLTNPGRNANNQDKKTENEQPQPLSVYLFTSLSDLDLSEQGKLASKILIEKIKLMLPLIDKPASELIQEIIKISGVISNPNEKELRESLANLGKLIDMVKLHEELYDSDLSNFLYYLDILDSLKIEIDAARIEEKGIRLMTSHSVKGLEYQTVILTNFAQGRFPIERYIGNPLIPTELLPEVKEEVHGLSEEDKETFIIDSSIIPLVFLSREIALFILLELLYAMFPQCLNKWSPDFNTSLNISSNLL